MAAEEPERKMDREARDLQRKIDREDREREEVKERVWLEALAEVAKKHENAIRVLQDEAAQQLEQIVRTNHRREQDLAAQCARYEIEHKENTKVQEDIHCLLVSIEEREHGGLAKLSKSRIGAQDK